MKLPKFTALLLAGSLMLAVAACGTPTVEGADKRYKSNKDRISVLITKQPINKAEFEKKIAEFEAEYKTAMAAGSDEEKIKKLGDLNSRMDKYIGAFEKDTAAAKKGGKTAPSNKLDKTGGTAPAKGTAPAAGGKLDGAAAAPAASGGMGGTAQPASGGMGGGTAKPAGGAAAAPAAGGMGGM